VSRAPASADWLLAGGNVVLPFAVSCAWLFFVRRFDRAQPEPLWLVFTTFALGAVAVVPAGFVEWGLDSLSSYANPTLLTFGRSPRAFPVAWLGFIVTVGVIEEGCKLLATWSLATHRREFDEPVDGMVYAAAAALGFAAAENVRYLALGRVVGALVAARAFMSVPAHLFFSTIWGFALGRRLVEPRRRVWPLFLAAVTLHGLFDTLLSIDGGLPWAVLVGLVVASIFIAQLRLALRHGAVAPQDGPASSSQTDMSARGPRELFRMGSRRAFAGFVAAMYLLSIAMFVLTLFQHSGRGAVTLGAASAVVLGLLGWAARGVAATLPLDVVVDDAGVTFAGGAIPYRDVVRIERRRLVGSPRRLEQMLIVGASRQLLLGPASHETIDALSHALAMRLSSVALRS
jgi:RsiW-degrading membrane proteinase PrsW (M82 family)